jgi:prepilin-type N-terminal cleavage/methylation domain-containing protein
MSSHESQHRGRRGFTMIEMLVAVAATLLMVVFLSKIFSSISGGVSRGASVSDIVQNARVVNSQIEADAAAMIGPSQNGFLLINKAVITNASGKLSSSDPPQTGSASAFPFVINDDQFAFVRTRGKLEPLASNKTNSAGEETFAAFARVWYGHCVRTETDAVDSPRPPDPGAGILGAANGLNQYPGQWILGRQALFLDGSTPAPTGNYLTGSPSSTGNASSIQNDGGCSISFVVGTPKLYNGYTDVAQRTLAQVTLDLKGSFLAPSAALFVANRLRCNPTPLVPSGGYTSATISQMHAILAVGVSDLIVEYSYDGPAALVTTWTRGVLYCGNFPAASPWPTMLRIRYRLHDRRGQLQGGDGDAGIVFEKIVRVPQ